MALGSPGLLKRERIEGLSVVVSSIVASDLLGCVLLSFARVEELFLLDVR